MADEERIEPTLDPNAAAPAAAPSGPPAHGDGAEEAEKPKSKKTLFIIIGLVVVIAGAVGGYMYMQHAAEAKRHQEAEEKRPENILKKQFYTFQLKFSHNNILTLSRKTPEMILFISTN